MSEIKYKIAAGTDVGLVRKNNEDNFVVCPDLSTSDWRIPQAGTPYADLGPFGSLLVVADGMGGANAGEVASSIAVETIQHSFTPEKLRDVVSDDKAIQKMMKEVVMAADERIFKHSKTDRSTRGMGTTVVMAWVLGNKVYVCWCGDSRCYMLNKRRGLMRLSKDHSYVQELVDRGELEPEFAADHPLSNVITRCLGDSENRAVPETKVFQLHNGDTLLLCSDGLSGLCNDFQILDLLIKYREDPAECKNELISAALNEGGYDNVTVALMNIEMPGNDEQPEDADASLPNGVKMNDKAAGEHTTLHNSQSTCNPTVYIRKKSMSWMWLLLGILVVVLLVFLLVRYIMGNSDKDSVVNQQEQIVQSVDNNDMKQDRVIKQDSTPVNNAPQKVAEETEQFNESQKNIDSIVVEIP